MTLTALKGDVSAQVLQFPTRNVPLFSLVAQHFSAIIVGESNGFQVFLQLYESREGKGFRTWTWLWDIKDRIATEYIPSLESSVFSTKAVRQRQQLIQCAL